MRGACIRDGALQTILFLLGLGAAAVSISFGFIWAYEQRLPLVFACSVVAWSGYLAAHYAATGQLVDEPVPHGEGALSWRVKTFALRSGWRYAGTALGLGLLVSGMFIGSGSVRPHDYLVTALGATFFLTGYVVAHYSATGSAL